MAIEITREQAERNKLTLEERGKLVDVAIKTWMREYKQLVPTCDYKGNPCMAALVKLEGQCARTQAIFRAQPVATLML